MVTIKVQ